MKATIIVLQILILAVLGLVFYPKTTRTSDKYKMKEFISSRQILKVWYRGEILNTDTYKTFRVRFDTTSVQPFWTLGLRSGSTLTRLKNNHWGTNTYYNDLVTITMVLFMKDKILLIGEDFKNDAYYEITLVDN